MRKFLLLTSLLLSFYCHADNAEYHIIPLSEAGETFDPSLQNMIRSPQGPNAKGQSITFSNAVSYYFENIYFNDPVSGKKVLLRLKGELPIISDGGFVAGSFIGTDIGYIWSLETGCRTIQPLYTYSAPYGVNNVGDVIFADVITKTPYTGKEFVTCLAMNDNKTINIGSIGAKYYTRGLALNDHRQIVGTFHEPAHQEHAFIWDENNGMRDLRKLISSDSGWNDLLKATHINNDGLIVGNGIYKGQPTQFLLIPGEF